MPQPPVRSHPSDGEFAEVFARRTRTPLRGFLPGRRVWNAVGGSVAVVLVIAGSASVVSVIDWSAPDSDKVTTAADEKVPGERTAGRDAVRPSVVPSPKAEDDGAKDPEIVYVPVQGGGAAVDPGSAATPGSADTPASGGSRQEPDASSTDRNVQSATTTGFVWSDGSVDSDTNDYWDQSTVTVRLTRPVTSLKVVVKIIQTGGVTSTGTWSSLGDKVQVAVAGNSGELDYVVTLRSGNTLDPGTYVFKFQYNHDRGRRDAGGDRYNVTATSTDAATEFRKGGF